jgi:multiple sugar transport system substrate-binding protein
MPEITRRTLVLAGGAAGSALLASCQSPPSSTGSAGATGADLTRLQGKILVWGPTGTGDLPARQAQIGVWNRQHPNLVAEITPAPFTSAQGIEGLQKLFAGVAAGDPPDAVYIDRFQLSNLGARRTLAAIDDKVKRDKYDLKRHFVTLLEEVTGIDGKPYGLPSTTDNRATVWNKRLLREAGLDAEKGPQTWNDLKTFATRASRTGGDGNLAQLGINPKLPGFGILYLWSWLAGAQFLSKDGHTAQYNHPGVAEALNFLLSLADAQGGLQKIDAYVAAGGGAGDPFANDRYAMQVAGPTGLVGTVMKQHPELEFGVGYVPVKNAGDKNQTFAGGFAWALPSGTKNPDASWGMLRSLMSEESLGAYADIQAATARSSGSVYLPAFTTVQEVDKAFRQTYATKIPAVDAVWDFTIKLMDIAKVRPVSPAAAEAWDALNECWTTVLARKDTPKSACDAMNARVQKALDEAYASLGKK